MQIIVGYGFDQGRGIGPEIARLKGIQRSFDKISELQRRIEEGRMMDKTQLQKIDFPLELILCFFA